MGMSDPLVVTQGVPGLAGDETRRLRAATTIGSAWVWRPPDAGRWWSDRDQSREAHMAGPSEQQTRMEGKWEQRRGRVNEAWGALTNDDLDRIDGRWDQPVGTVRERTGEATR
jgi:uncharacterized protein YjbJ (UPF0337 family)